MRHLKQYGCRRSGTNWLRSLIQENYRDVHVHVHEPVWKHGRHHDPQGEMAGWSYVVMSKHPLHWLASMKRYNWPDAGHDMTARETRFYAEAWIAKHSDWLLRLPPRRTTWLRWMDLARDVRGLRVLETELGLQRFDGAWRDVVGVVRPSSDGARSLVLGKRQDRAYGLQGGFLGELTGTERGEVKKTLRRPENLAVLQRLGYEVDPWERERVEQVIS